MTEVSIYQAPNGQELELVRKGNKLIEAKYDLTVNQQRILLNMLELIQPYDEEFKTYTISIADLAKKHGLETNKKIYTQFQQALDGLVGYILKIPTEDKKILRLLGFQVLCTVKARDWQKFNFPRTYTPICYS
jgi:plasmid replication initiation protein